MENKKLNIYKIINDGKIAEYDANLNTMYLVGQGDVVFRIMSIKTNEDVFVGSFRNFYIKFE